MNTDFHGLKNENQRTRSSHPCFIRVHPWLNNSSSLVMLILAGVLRRKRDEHVFQRRADLVDLGTRDADTAKFFVDLLAAHAFIHEKVHRLTEDRGVQHALHFAHRAQRHGDDRR